MKVFLGLLLIAGFGILGVPAPPDSMLCFSCNVVDDPHQCTNVAKCHHEDMCYTEVNQVSGVSVFTMSCKPRHECDMLSMFGKRDATTVCRKCCPISGCNKDLCADYLSTTPAAAVTTTMGAMASDTTTAAAAMTTTQASCRDHEEDGFKCTDYDVYNFCTDTSGFAFVVAHEKCPKHCGFCGGSGGGAATLPGPTATPVDTSTTMPASATSPATTQALCEDREDANFKCTDKLDLCVDTSYYAMQLALDRCPKFCDLCNRSTQMPGSSTKMSGSSTSSGFTIV